MWITGQRNRAISRKACAATRAVLGFFFAFVLVAAATPPAHAQQYTESMLYSFTGGTDGGSPYATPTRDAAGNVFGTTYSGGNLSGCSGGCGTVFKIDASGAQTVLSSFTGGLNGKHPYTGVILDRAGNLYGTTYMGGTSSNCPLGCGTIFKVSTTGREGVLYSFTGGANGSRPFTGLAIDGAGNLYGAAQSSGSAVGILYKLDRAGNFTVLYSFTGGADGGEPEGPVLVDTAGNVYGVTSGGGTDNWGVVFKVDTAGNETVLYNFTGNSDGAFPIGGMVRDAGGNFYGATAYGGIGSGFSGFGVAYKLQPNGHLVTLHRFGGSNDGMFPNGYLVLDGAGNLYGTTANGGLLSDGIVFKLDRSGNETVLYSFTGAVDGTYPEAGVTRDAAGNLYGTTSSGGASDSGTAFELTP